MNFNVKKFGNIACFVIAGIGIAFSAGILMYSDALQENAINEAAELWEGGESLNSDEVVAQYPDNKVVADLLDKMEKMTGVQKKNLIKNLSGKSFKILGCVVDVEEDVVFNEGASVSIVFRESPPISMTNGLIIRLSKVASKEAWRLTKGCKAVFVGRFPGLKNDDQLGYLLVPDVAVLVAIDGNFQLMEQ